MQIKSYNILMLTATIIAWLGFFLVINSFDPQQASVLIFVFFYASLFLSILGTLTILGYGLRKFWRRKKEFTVSSVNESFRQAVIMASVFIIALLLQSGRLLNWWNIALIVLAATILEFIFLVFPQAEKKQRQ